MSPEIESEIPDVIFAEEAMGTRYGEMFVVSSKGERFPVLAQEVITILHSRGRDLKRIAKIEQEILDTIRADKIEGPVANSIQALLSELKGEKDNALSFARAAIDGVSGTSHNDNASFTNAIAVLCIYAEYREAFEYLDLSLKKWPNNIPVIEHAVISAYIVAQFDRAQIYLHRLSMASRADLDPLMHMRATSLVDLQDAARSMGFSEDDLLDRLLVTRAAVEEFGLLVLREKRAQLEDGSSIMYYYLDADRKICAKCSRAIYGKLFREFENTGMDLLSVICRPIGDYDGALVRGRD